MLSVIARYKNLKLIGKHYATWKSNLNMILVVDDLWFVLMVECLLVPTRNACQTVSDAYDRRTMANKKARVYILTIFSDVLAKKHVAMVTACMIMEFLQEMFGQSSIHI